MEVNERQKRRLGEKVASHFGGNLKGKKIAIWGLAFKPGTDDIREAPALVLIEQLLAAGATVSATDPVAIGAVRKQLGDRITYEEAHYECARGADALVLVTEWHEFRRPSFERLKSLLNQPVIFDGRDIVGSDRAARAPASSTTESDAEKTRRREGRRAGCRNGSW